MKVPDSRQYHFQRYTGPTKGARSTDTISIYKSGSIALSRHFYYTNGISSFRYVDFFYDEARRAIGLSFRKEKTEDSSKITHDDKITTIAARRFMRLANIDPMRDSGRFSYTKVDIAGRTLYVFELPKA